MGIKVVRGAYLYEENALAEKFGYESPICENFEATTVNIEANLEHLIDNMHN